MFIISEYLHQLQSNTKSIIAIANLHLVQSIKNDDDTSWSVLEVMEHLYIVDINVMAGMLKDNLQNHDTSEIFGQEKLQRIIVQMRARKTKVPDGMQPIGQFDTMQDFINAFIAQRTLLSNYLSTNKIIVDNRKYIHPYLGDMSISDWCYFLIAHSERHLLQIHDISGAK